MTLLRFSQIEQKLYAPESDGQLDPDTGVGDLLQVVRPGDQGHPPTELIDYVSAAQLSHGGPATMPACAPRRLRRSKPAIGLPKSQPATTIPRSIWPPSPCPTM